MTGARPTRLQLQLQAVENLYRAGVRVLPASMVNFSTPEGIAGLQRRLSHIAPRFDDGEVEEFVLYGSVQERLRKAGIGYSSAHSPNKVPPEQV